nr:hypothetical protein FFPRI1PSEUD_44960 [Pseudomonas sp. FFPRI_1]
MSELVAADSDSRGHLLPGEWLALAQEKLSRSLAVDKPAGGLLIRHGQTPAFDTMELRNKN